MKKKEEKPKVLIYDIEVLSSMSADCGSIYCMAYMEHGSKKVNIMSVRDYPETYEKCIFDDSKLVKDIAKVLNGASILIGHNSKSTTKWGFDLKYINSRLILHKLPPIKHIAEIDTYHDLSRKHLRFRSNRLGELAKALNLPHAKDKMDFPKDWNNVIVKKRGAANKMEKYCKMDVKVTEQLYDRLKCLHNNLPSAFGLYGLSRHDYPCPSCMQFDKVHSKDSRLLANRKAYKRLVCRRCQLVFKGPAL